MPHLHEHHFAVTRTARYVTLGDASAPVTQVWFACHGYGQLAAPFAQNLSVLDDGTRLVVVPEALSRFYVDGGTGRHGPHSKIGASWMTREDRLAEIEDHISYLDALYALVFTDLARDGVEVIALGFSQGAATVCRWLARGQARVDRVVLWGGMIPQDVLAAQGRGGLRDLPLTFVVGTRDEFVSQAALAEYRQELESHGVTAPLVTFDGGHRLDDETLRQLTVHG